MQRRECAVSSSQLARRPELRLYKLSYVWVQESRVGHNTITMWSLIISDDCLSSVQCFLLVDSLKTFYPSRLFLPSSRPPTPPPPRASYSLMRKLWKVCISKPLSIIPVLELHCWEGGFVYHTVRSRRLDEDYTSYIPCGRYIGMCVTVKYVDVNMGGFFLFCFGCIKVSVYTIRDH